MINNLLNYCQLYNFFVKILNYFNDEKNEFDL